MEEKAAEEGLVPMAPPPNEAPTPHHSHRKKTKLFSRLRRKKNRYRRECSAVGLWAPPDCACAL